MAYMNKRGECTAPFPELDNYSDMEVVDIGETQFADTVQPFSPLHSYFTEHKSEPVALSWKGVTFTLAPDGAELLHAVSGSVRSGELMAIMGPSGAGKSTLLNVLAARAPYGTAKGFVDMNGETPSKYRKKMAYVMQEDALFPTQTPREVLMFTAALRLPALSHQERVDLVESLLGALALNKCADSMIGSVMIKGLSGGEKKRTAIGVELISSPSIIFLDEPTSGLDSHSAYEVVKHLRTLAQAGSTVICTIHQPSSETYDLFSKVMLLRSGSVVYEGPTGGLIKHFATVGLSCKANYNPADFAMHNLLTMDDTMVQPLIKRSSMLQEKIEANGVQSADLCDFSDLRCASPFAQFYHLTKRELVQLVRDRHTMAARYLMAVVKGLMVGLFFLQAGKKWGASGSPAEISQAISNHWGALVFCSINTMFLSALSTVLVFPAERPVFMREYVSGTYGSIPYLLSKTVVEIPASLVQTLLQYTPVYFLVGLQANFAYLILCVTLFGLVISSMALFIGAATTRPETAINLLPGIFVPQILACGFFVSINAVPPALRWIQWACPLKYGLALATVCELFPPKVPDNREEEVAYLLRTADIDVQYWPVYAAILFGVFIFFRIAATIILARRARAFK
ncbi:ABC transporter G family member 7 [Diplonema papillatum]|nr:ABC transporter G family member 7 [Diplonema papillatum]